ncbi:MAG: SDR family NAD(P)-dependent oxidoreductase [Steroidobacteraceae bacterium]
MARDGISGKVVICTGAGAGIGRAVALALAERSARLALVDVSESAAESVADAVRAVGAEAIAVTANVTDGAQVDMTVKAVVERFGRIDGLYNGAGIAGPTKAFHDTDDATWRSVMSVNVFGSVNFIRAVAPVMISQGAGTIVNVSSGAGLRATDAGHAPYVTSKHAVIGMTKAAAVEYARYGIRINAIAPGPTATEMVRKYIADNPGVDDHLRQRILLGRLGEPAEIARMVLFLFSEEASFCTGAVYEVNGGELAR